MVIRFSGHGFGLESMFDLALTAFGALVGAVVWNVHPRAFALLWIYFGLTAGLLVLAIAGTLISSERHGPETLTQLVSGFGSTVIWFLYFKQSDRVQATFGRNM